MNKLLLFIFLAGAGMVSCSGPQHSKTDETDPPIPVRVMILKQEIIFEPVRASGRFTTDDEAYRGFMTGGIIRQIFVSEGDPVKKGQLLAVLDVTGIDAMVTQASLGFEKAQRDYNRVKNLYRDSVVTLEQYENSATALEVAREQLKAARFNRDHSEIRATGDGYILRKMANEGQVVGAGTPVLLTNGGGNGDWLLKVSVSDGQWSSLEPGDSAMITTDISGLPEIRGVVAKKSESVDPVSGTFTVEIRPIVSLQGKVAAGMFGKARIIPSRGRALWRIPYDALLDADANQGYVFVIKAENRATRVAVSIAGISEREVLIEGGLEGYTTLITSGNAYLTDQSSIAILK